MGIINITVNRYKWVTHLFDICHFKSMFLKNIQYFVQDVKLKSMLEPKKKKMIIIKKKTITDNSV